MNLPLTPRQPTETDYAWRRRAKKYIRNNAPESQHIYIRWGTPGKKSQRLWLPIAGVIVGILIMVVGTMTANDYEALTGPNTKQDTFKIISIEKYKSSRTSSRVTYTPTINLRGEKIKVKGASGKINTHTIGEPILVTYTTTGKPLAMVPGFAEDSASWRILPIAFGIFFIVLGIVGRIFIKPSISTQYENKAMAALDKGEPLPLS